MLRVAILLTLLVLAAVLILPFLVSSLYIDQRGVIIPGRVSSKREDVAVLYSTWKRSSETTVEYSKPDGTGVSFLTVQLTPVEYDGLHVGQAVDLHYLRLQDVPDVPLASRHRAGRPQCRRETGVPAPLCRLFLMRFLRHSQLLPTVRLANKQTFSGLRLLFTEHVAVSAAILAGVAILLLWRIARVPGFGWALVGCVFLGSLIIFFQEFPRPTPEPAVALTRSVGRVKSLGRIDRLFTGSHSRGIETDQPIQVAGIEFTPQGRTESVLAVDLIDEGSLPGLKQQSPVVLIYERLSPRTAYIQGASRGFVRRNLVGIAVQGIVSLLVILVILGGAWFLGRAYKRLLRKV